MPNTPIFLSKLNRNFPEIAWPFQQKQRGDHRVCFLIRFTQIVLLFYSNFIVFLLKLRSKFTQFVLKSQEKTAEKSHFIQIILLSDCLPSP